MKVNRERMVKDFRALGLNAGDVVIVHSALSSLGRVEGGAKEVILALQEVLTSSGTLVMPSFGGGSPFDVKNTPSGLGAITETFRKYPGVVRSSHPTHSIVALGPLAEDLVKDHLKSPTACGLETPYGRLWKAGGKILLLGVDQDRNTIMHTVEEMAEASYLSDHEGKYKDESGEIQILKLKLFPGPHRHFIGLDSLLQSKNIERVGKVGQAAAKLIDIEGMVRVMCDEFKRDPALVLCRNPNCDDCVMQRRKIRLDRLKQEDFILSAQASSISSYPDQIAEEMNRAGIYDLVIDRLYGKPVWMVEAKKLKRASSIFAEEGIQVGAVYGLSDSLSFDLCLATARSLGAKALVMPLVGEPERLFELASASGMDLFFENTIQTSRMCLEQLKKVNKANVLAFNPSGFAIMGEKPFLDTYSQSAVRHRIGILYFVDATFGGNYTLPGEGNGEVKEMLSILRCRSFAGRVVLGTGPGGPEFRELVRGFWSLLETM
ncbi:MAG: AAC(3) family N-acetyltransferase [Phycisphaerae bacterium]